MPQDSYDCLIVGGGPAGLSAAIYMGRFLRSVLVLDNGQGRSSYGQINDNYLGFPNGVSATELRELGKQHALRFGVEFLACRVDRMLRETPSGFSAFTDAGEFTGRTVILCTGVTDIWPAIPCVADYVGKSLFWCIVCDGFRAYKKRVVLFGRDDEAATTACQFLTYTDQVVFIYPPGEMACSEEKLKEMRCHKIELVEGLAASVEGAPEKVEAVLLDDGRRIPADIMFSLLGCRPNSKLALDLGVECSPGGYVKVDEEGYTSVPGVFAAGDLSRMHTHQAVAAAAEGGEAAQTCNYWLYSSFQREEPNRPSEQELSDRVNLS
jgi:thioredoxin reductase (NADPH)